MKYSLNSFKWGYIGFEVEGSKLFKGGSIGEYLGEN